ncbi:hypothetical protein OC845_004827 [Tilletia horrida]|nr:hypothetical protein OC845_004827 [Tilletia horrida]
MALLQRLRQRIRGQDAGKEGPAFVDDRPDLPYQNSFTRIAIVSSLWATALVSIPFWWKTTTITRLPLPEDELSIWSARGSCPIRVPVQLNVHLGARFLPSSYPHYSENEEPPVLFHSQNDYFTFLQDHLVRDLDAASGRLPSPSSQTLEAEGLDDSCLDWRISFVAESLSGEVTLDPARAPAPLTYDVLVGHNADLTSSTADRLRLSDLTVSDLSSPSKLASDLANRLRTVLELPLRTLPVADTRAIQYSRPLRLVFSLLNEDATRGGAVDGWELPQALRSSELESLIQQLGGVHDVRVESQVLWYAPLAFRPTTEETLDRSSQQSIISSTGSSEDKDATESNAFVIIPETEKESGRRYFVEFEDLKVFVNAAAWSLTSAVSSLRQIASAPILDDLIRSNRSHSITSLVEEEERTLHLLLYIPAADRRPLVLRDPATGNASNAHAWMIPQWGGVVLYNPPSSSLHNTAKIVPGLRVDELAEPIRLWTSQLKTLLGLRHKPAAETPFCSSVSRNDAGEACVPRRLPADLLAIRRLVESAREAVATLASTARLVRKIPNLGVGSEVKGDVQAALDLLAQLDSSLQSGRGEVPADGTGTEESQDALSLQHALSLASLSSTLASRAFFHPSMLGLLYFPEEHKYAVYTPLFGPVAVPLVFAVLRELVSWRKARRRKKEDKAQKSKSD